MNKLSLVAFTLVCSFTSAQIFAAVDLCQENPNNLDPNCHTIVAKVPNGGQEHCSHINIQLLPNGPGYLLPKAVDYQNGVQYQTSLYSLSQIAGASVGKYTILKTTYTCDNGIFYDSTNLRVEAFPYGNGYVKLYGSTSPDYETVYFSS